MSSAGSVSIRTDPLAASRQRRAGDGLDVGRLDDVHEVELAQRRPLVQDLDAELLDVAIDLKQPLRVGLQGLHALLGQRREKDVGRHCASLPWQPGRRRGARRRGRAAASARRRRGTARLARRCRPASGGALRACCWRRRRRGRAWRAIRGHGRSPRVPSSRPRTSAARKPSRSTSDAGTARPMNANQAIAGRM